MQTVPTRPIVRARNQTSLCPKQLTGRRKSHEIEILVTLPKVLLDIIKTNWNMPTWGITLLIAALWLLAILAIIGLIWYILQYIRKIDKKDEESTKKDNEERDQKLIEAFKNALREVKEEEREENIKRSREGS